MFVGVPNPSITFTIKSIVNRHFQREHEDKDYFEEYEEGYGSEYGDDYDD